MASHSKSKSIEVDLAVVPTPFVSQTCMFSTNTDSSSIQLENQDLDDYASSGYDTSTASLTSSINEYLVENGELYIQFLRINANT